MVHRLVVPALLLVGCNGSPPALSDAGADGRTDGRIGQCAAGLKSYGPACTPIFDECKDDEVPLLGGGCKKVGVEECTTAGGGVGIQGPPDWGCTPIGPPAACLAGWAKTSDGWCEPILPSAPCGPGTMEVIGKTECQAIGDCGAGTWGKIATTSETLHVDKGYTGSGSDGSAAKPYLTIGAALAAAKSGAQIAIAAGSYAEDVVIDKAVVLEGRCAQLVTLVGQDKSRVAAIEIAASDVTLRGLRITGPTHCVVASGKRVQVAQSAIENCGERGIDVVAGDLAVRDSLVARCHRQGVLATDATLLVERCAVRYTEGRQQDGTYGHGIAVRTFSATGSSSLTVRDCLVSGSRMCGIGVSGTGTATVERTVVRDGRPQASDQLGGMGFSIFGKPDWPGSPSVTIRDCLVAGNRTYGLLVSDGHVALQRTVVRDTQCQGADGMFGSGVSALREAAASDPQLEVSESLIARSRGFGIEASSTVKATVERTVVQDTLRGCVTFSAEGGIAALPNPVQGAPGALAVRDALILRSGNFGVVSALTSGTLERVVVRDSGDAGIATFARAWPPDKPTEQQAAPTMLLLRDALVAGSRGVGVVLGGTSATLERLVVRDTQEGSDRPWGLGIQAMRGDARDPSLLVVQDARVAGHRAVGIVLGSTDGTIERTVVRDTWPAADGTTGIGLAAVPEPGVGRASTLALRDSVVARSHAAGVYVLSSTATAERCQVSDTAVEVASEGWGDGIQVASAPDGFRGRLDLVDSLVERSARANLSYYDARGSVRRSVFREAVFAVDLEEAATPDIADDNVFEGNLENRVTWGNKLAPSPPPKLPPPPKL